MTAANGSAAAAASQSSQVVGGVQVQPADLGAVPGEPAIADHLQLVDLLAHPSTKQAAGSGRSSAASEPPPKANPAWTLISRPRQSR
jgi:hypothetical protein